MKPSATRTTVSGPVGELLQAGTVLDHPAPLRHLHDSGAGYKYPDLLTYLLTVSSTNSEYVPLGSLLFDRQKKALIYKN